MIKFSLVDVKDINSSTPRSEFSESKLDRLADLILDSGGIVRPLVLKQTDIDNYVVIDGDLEYYAAVKAKEKKPREAELVNAFIVSPKSEELVTEQLQMLAPALKHTREEKAPSNLETRLTNIELRFEKHINQLNKDRLEEKQKIEARLKELESNTTQKIEPLETINTLDQENLVLKLKRSKIPSAEKLAKAICVARDQKKQKKFEDYQDVVESVKAVGKGLLGEKKLLMIIDDWSRR
ncbi:chromosome partitioning protein ParB [Oculatella sp. FACHB-28]|uniref:ParB N-terminal domain-containing protein n=1 Tax=Oculatella sp. FACHB-28 TaxID=2692845 RepID=UPI00168935E4|nr:chromosome partitioning protein ParB [Oculatella sp. FACHB-28]MBD2059529.1 chromosome partitioning protein ParB [Oculatella sp. FACHB-28]